MVTFSKRRTSAFLATVSVSALALTSCTSSGSKSTPTASATGATTGSTAVPAGGPASAASTAKTYGSGKSVIVIGGPLADPFFSAVEKGGAEASRELGATYQYTSPANFNNIASDLTNLLNTAITKKPDVLVVGDFVPPVEDALIKKATAAGITTVMYNSGLGSWQQDGAVGFVGEDPTAAGKAAGTNSASAGVKNGLCVNQQPENPVLQLRCDGYVAQLKAAGGTGTTLVIPASESTNDQGVTQSIKGYLLSHPNVDGVFTLGSAIAVDAETAATQSGKSLKIGTTDLSVQVLNDVKSGKLLFTIDQQPWLQTYDGVMIGLQSAVLGLHPLNATLTSPLVITTSNADQVLAVQQAFGIRGAS